MKTIIAEKPSVAREIARIVGATKREEGYFEGGGYAVTWALGHLITAAMPEPTASRVSTKKTCRFFLPSLLLFPRQIKEVKAISRRCSSRPTQNYRKLFRACEGIIVATDAGGR